MIDFKIHKITSGIMTKLVCPVCGYNNNTVLKFCPLCGENLVVYHIDELEDITDRGGDNE